MLWCGVEWCGVVYGPRLGGVWSVGLGEEGGRRVW